MSHRLPTDAEIEKLITQVYEGMPSPEQSRLSSIESQLLKNIKINKEKKPEQNTVVDRFSINRRFCNGSMVGG